MLYCILFNFFFSFTEISLNGQHGKLPESANIKFLLINLLHNFTYRFLLRSAHSFCCCLINILSPHLLDQLWTVSKRKYFKVSWLYLLNPPSLFNWIYNVFYVNKWQSLQPHNTVKDKKLHGYEINWFEISFCYGKNELLMFLSRVYCCVLSYATNVFLHYVLPSELTLFCFLLFNDWNILSTESKFCHVRLCQISE